MSTAPAEVTAPLPDDTSAESPAQQNIFRRILQGDLASVRVIFGLIVIWAIFQIANDHFLTAINLTNLFLQITAVGLISVGVVFVLLLGSGGAFSMDVPPNTSAWKLSSERETQLICTNGLAFRWLKLCSDRAAVFLPVPLSPVMRTSTSASAT